MTKSAACFFHYVVIGAVALVFGVIMFALAWPIFSMPADRTPVGIWDRAPSCHTDSECAEQGGNGDPE